MPSRNYCDRCDELITENDPYFSISIDKIKEAINAYRSSDLKVGDNWVNANQHKGMVCKSCTIKILEVLLKEP